MENTLLFGATGAIGKAIQQRLISSGRNVVGCARTISDSQLESGDMVRLDPFSSDFDIQVLAPYAPFSAVIWSQGMNCADSVFNVDSENSLEMYKSNCLYIMITLRELLKNNLIAKSSKFVVISSIWQNIARQDKLSYSVTKAALQGLVRSASVDLATQGHVINAILPGPLDTPMTQRNLTEDELHRLKSATPFGALPQVNDVANMALYLSSELNHGITGQFIAVDLGLSHVRLV